MNTTEKLKLLELSMSKVILLTTIAGIFSTIFDIVRTRLTNSESNIWLIITISLLFFFFFFVKHILYMISKKQDTIDHLADELEIQNALSKKVKEIENKIKK